MNSAQKIFLLLPLAFLLAACGSRDEKKSGGSEAIVVAIEGDIDSFNPLFAEDITAGEINDLLYPRLLESEYDEEKGTLVFGPLFAKTWEYRNDKRDIVFHLRTDVQWTDGKPATSRDVQLSYELYGDPEVGSIRQGATEQLALTNGALNIAKSVEVIDDSTVIFHFVKHYPGQLFDAGLPIIPAHVFENIPPKDLRTAEVNKNPVTAGPFMLEKWTPLQEVVLVPYEESTLPRPAAAKRLVFRVLPDYRTRISQVESGEVDLASGLRIEDAKAAKQNESLAVISTPGRDYDFLGWNNIDPVRYGESDGKIVKPHPLFGSPTVRRALTMAINRDEIVQAYLGEFGQVAMGGVSPLFKWAYNDTLRPLPCDKQQAMALLAGQGWGDANGNGILDKNGKEFSFTLEIPAGNQLRNVIATVIQRQLRDVNIAMQIEQVERSTFWQTVTERKYDAWFAGFSVPLQMQLEELWGSDLGKYPFNLAGFRNERVDKILAATKDLDEEIMGADLWKEFQVVVQQQQPVTFLFWINNLVAVNRRLHGTHVGALGIFHKAWDWRLEPEQVAPTDARDHEQTRE